MARACRVHGRAEETVRSLVGRPGVGIATGYGQDVPGFIPGSARFFSSQQRPDRRDGAVGIATGHGLDDRGVGVGVPVGSRIENFLFSTSSRPALGPTQPPIQWVLGVKRPGRETDHSPPAKAEDKKTWVYSSTSPYAFMGVVLT
jgi:hypothetical protein